MKKFILFVFLTMSFSGTAFAGPDSNTAGTAVAEIRFDLPALQKQQESLKKSLSHTIAREVNIEEILRLSHKKRVLEQFINVYTSYYKHKGTIEKKGDKIDELIHIAQKQTFDLYWQAILTNFKNLSGEKIPYGCEKFTAIDSCEESIFVTYPDLFSVDEKKVRAKYRTENGSGICNEKIKNACMRGVPSDLPNTKYSYVWNCRGIYGGTDSKPCLLRKKEVERPQGEEVIKG